MRITLVRSATVIVEIAGKRILVDPMLDDMGARPPIEHTRNQVANPTVPLPFPAEEVVRGLDAVIVTHRHRDHLDTRGEELVPRDVPTFCPEDEEALRELGLDARAIADELDWDGLTITRTPARHGSGRGGRFGTRSERQGCTDRDRSAHGSPEPLLPRARDARGRRPGGGHPPGRRDRRGVVTAAA